MNSRSETLVASVAVLGVLTVGGCQSVRSPAERLDGASSLCNRDAAEALADRDRVTDEEARRMTGASLVRQIRPGQPVTMDYRQERVTIETDPATSRIVRAVCG